MLILTAAAILVRRSGLGPSSLWLDDAWVALVHRVSDLGDVWRMGLTSPGFAMLLRIWLGAVGLSSGAAQAIPFVAGMLTPGAAYLVGRRLGLRPVPALLGGVLLVAAPVHADYSVRVKQYTLDGLLVLALLGLAVPASERPSAARPWRRLAVAAGAATVVSTAVAPAAAAIAVGALVPGLHRHLDERGRPDARWIARWPAARWVAGYLGFAVSWGGWMVGRRLSERLTEYWEGFYLEGWPDLPRIATTLVAGLTGEDHGLVVLALVVVSLVGAVLAVRRAPMVAVLLWGPLAGALVLALLGAVPLATGRTELYLFPVLALGLAWTIDRLAAAAGRSPRADAVTLGALGLTLLLVLPVAEVAYPEEDVRPLVELVERRLEPTDQVLVSSAAIYATALYGPWMTGIRRNQTPLGFAPRFTERVTVIRVSGDTSHIARKYADLPAGSRVWLLATHVVADRLEGARTRLRELGFRPVEEAGRPGAVLELWVRAAEASARHASAGGTDRPHREEGLAERGPPAVLDPA